MAYTLYTDNGNCGESKTFSTYEEAYNFGDRIWKNLSKHDRAIYKDRTLGSSFFICEGEDENGRMIHDFTED